MRVEAERRRGSFGGRQMSHAEEGCNGDWGRGRQVAQGIHSFAAIMVLFSEVHPTNVMWES